MIDHNKYRVPENESEVLPNLLGLQTTDEINIAETEGLIVAETIAIEDLSDKTRFDLEYIYNLHRMAFDRVYSFAGQLRTVDVSKGGFAFPSAKYLPTTMQRFEKDVLKQLPQVYSDRDSLIDRIAVVHAELLFIHPFREGNGRVMRILANAMAVQQGYELLHFEKITDERFDEYVAAVQAAADENYEPMRMIIRGLF